MAALLLYFLLLDCLNLNTSARCPSSLVEWSITGVSAVAFLLIGRVYQPAFLWLVSTIALIYV